MSQWSALCGVILLVAVRAGEYHANGQTPPLEGVADLKTLDDYTPEGSVFYPRGPHFPLTIDRLEIWADMLGASEPVRHFMRARYPTYVEWHNTCFARMAPGMVDACVELSTTVRSDGYASEAYEQVLDDANALDERMRREVAALEHRYIDLLEAVLIDEQIERLNVLRAEAMRRNFRDLRYDARWVGIELRPLWRNDSTYDLATPAQREAMREILDDYELRLTPLIRQCVEFRHRAWEEQVDILLDGRQDAGSRYREAAEIRVENARRIRVLHDATLERIRATLPELAPAFIAAVKQRVYPELYPDPQSLHGVFESLLADDEIGQDVLAALRRTRDEYTFEYDVVHREIEAFCDDWGEHNLAGEGGYQYILFGDELDKRVHTRHELAERWLATLAELVGSDVLQRHISSDPDS